MRCRERGGYAVEWGGVIMMMGARTRGAGAGPSECAREHWRGSLDGVLAAEEGGRLARRVQPLAADGALLVEGLRAALVAATGDVSFPDARAAPGAVLEVVLPAHAADAAPRAVPLALVGVVKQVASAAEVLAHLNAAAGARLRAGLDRRAAHAHDRLDLVAVHRVHLLGVTLAILRQWQNGHGGGSRGVVSETA